MPPAREAQAAGAASLAARPREPAAAPAYLLQKSEVAAFSDGNTNIAACNPAMEKPPAVFLSVPSARAMVSGARVLGLLDPLASAASTPPPSFVDGSEIFNYYHIDYPAKASAELTIVTEMVATDDLGDYLLQIGVQAPSIQAARLPTSVTILVDTSTSMEGQSLLRARAAVRALAMGLNKDDILTLLTTDTDFEPVRRRAAGALDPALLQSADKITVSGTGSLGRALERAYEQATSPSSLLAGGLNRLVVITDGGAPERDRHQRYRRALAERADPARGRGRGQRRRLQERPARRRDDRGARPEPLSPERRRGGACAPPALRRGDGRGGERREHLLAAPGSSSR